MKTDLTALRRVLKTWTWRDVCISTATPKPGIWFFGRVGCFLNKDCVAVCALDTIVAMHYTKSPIVLGYQRIAPFIDGKFANGIVLFERDLPMLGLDPNALVITDE